MQTMIMIIGDGNFYYLKSIIQNNWQEKNQRKIYEKICKDTFLRAKCLKYT